MKSYFTKEHLGRDPLERNDPDGVGIYLIRRAGSDNWQLDCTSTKAEADRDVIANCRQKVLEILPVISPAWHEEDLPRVDSEGAP